MATWAKLFERMTSGELPPGMTLPSYGASQPVGGDKVDCLALRVVSFNFGINQGMLTSTRQWEKKHVFTLRDLLESMGKHCSNDFIFGSEMGDIGQGFEAELGLLDGNEETDDEAFLSVV